MSNIKKYEEKLVVNLKSGKKLYTNLKLEQLQKALANNDFIVIDECLVNKYEIVTAYKERIDGIESFILSLSDDVQKKVRTREETKKQNVGRGFDSIEEIQKRIQKNI